MRSILFISILHFLNTVCNAQESFDPPSNTPVVRAIESETAITLDGKLLEEVWKKAPRASDFFRMEPRQGGKPLYANEVQLVLDKRNLYIGVYCKDSVGRKGIRVQDYRRDFV